jgi:hypothetical protein
MVNNLQRDVIKEFTAEAPVKIGGMAQALGLQVFISPLATNISGLIEPVAPGSNQFRIKINKFETQERQRFTIAHEIAHFLLHRDKIANGIVDSILYRSSLSSRLEAEANRLAADLIMPAALVRQELDKFDGKRTEETAIALAQHFRVSLPAMKVRLGLEI